MPMTRFALHGI